MFAYLHVNKNRFSFYKITEDAIIAIAIDLRLKNTPDYIDLAEKVDNLSTFWISKPEILSSHKGYLINMLKLSYPRRFPVDTLQHIYVASCVFPQLISATPFKCSTSACSSYRFIKDSDSDSLEIVKQPLPECNRTSVYLVKDV